MKKSKGASPSSKAAMDKVMKHMVELANEAKHLVKEAKTKFERADDQTKKKVIAGLAGATALMAAVVGAHKLRRWKKKSKK